jgi:hypothetical protein
MSLTLTCLPDHVLRLIRGFVGPQRFLVLNVVSDPPRCVRSGDAQRLPRVVTWLPSAVPHPDLSPCFDSFVVGVHEICTELCTEFRAQRLRMDFERESAERRCVLWFVEALAEVPEDWAPSCCLLDLRWRSRETPIMAFAVAGRCAAAFDLLYGGYRSDSLGLREPGVEMRWDLRSRNASRGRYSKDSIYGGNMRRTVLSRLRSSSQTRVFARGELQCDDGAPLMCELSETLTSPLNVACSAIYHGTLSSQTHRRKLGDVC